MALSPLKMSPEVKAFYKPRIGNIQAFLLVASSVAFWGVQFLFSLTVIGDIVSWILGVIQTGLYFVWLSFLGAYGGKKAAGKIAATGAAAVVEFIPFIDDFPADILEMIVMILLTRLEDRQTAQLKAAAAAQAKAADQARRAEYLEYINERNAEIRELSVSNPDRYAASEDEIKEVEKEDAIVIQQYNTAKNDTRPESEKLLDYKDEYA